MDVIQVICVVYDQDIKLTLNKDTKEYETWIDGCHIFNILEIKFDPEFGVRIVGNAILNKELLVAHIEGVSNG
jgi:hypothetical protein